MSRSKQETERKRAQLELHAGELKAKLAMSDTLCQDALDRLAGIISEIETIGSQLQEADPQANTASKSMDGLESQLDKVFANLVVKYLLKLKAKHESTIGELEDKCRKGNQQEMERTKSKLESDLNNMKKLLDYLRTTWNIILGQDGQLK